MERNEMLRHTYVMIIKTTVLQGCVFTEVQSTRNYPPSLRIWI